MSVLIRECRRGRQTLSRVELILAPAPPLPEGKVKSPARQRRCLDTHGVWSGIVGTVDHPRAR